LVSCDIERTLTLCFGRYMRLWSAKSSALCRVTHRGRSSAKKRVLLQRHNRLWPILVLVPQAMLPVVVRHVTPLDEDAVDLRAQIERVSARDEEVRELPLRDRADFLLCAEDLRRPDGECLERDVLRQAAGDRQRGVEWHVPRVRAVAGREGELHSGLVQDGRLRVDLVIRLVILRRRLDRSENDPAVFWAR